MATVYFFISSGAAPFTASIDPAVVPDLTGLATGQHYFTNVPDGSYTVLVTDALGCESSFPVSIACSTTTTTVCEDCTTTTTTECEDCTTTTTTSEITTTTTTCYLEYFIWETPCSLVTTTTTTEQATTTTTTTCEEITSVSLVVSPDNPHYVCGNDTDEGIQFIMSAVEIPINVPTSNRKWYFKTTPEGEATEIVSNEGNGILQFDATLISYVGFGDRYYYIVSYDMCGNSATSEDYLFSITESPEITSQPVDLYLCMPENGNFIVISPTVGVTYQWQIYELGWQDITYEDYGIENATTNSINVDYGWIGSSFRCVLTNGICETISDEVEVIENCTTTTTTTP